MGWRQASKPITRLANKALVQEFLDMEPAPHDRPLSEKRLLVYERILNAGEFRTVVWASCICKETNGIYRVNGKHTATLLSRREPIPEFHVTIERYEADTLIDVGKLYNTFDSNLASRTIKDINAAFAATVPGLREIPGRYIDLAVAAISQHTWNESQLREIPPAERAEQLLDHPDFVHWLIEIIPSNTTTARITGKAGLAVSRVLLRAAVVRAMFATWLKHPKLAKQFWEKVRDESAPDNANPTRVLARWLLQTTVFSSRGRAPHSHQKKLVGHRELYAKCIHAWNAWRKEEHTNLNYHATKPLPEPK